MILTKLNESFSSIDGELNELKSVSEFLKVERPGAFFEPLVKSGFKSPYNYFTTVVDKKLWVMNGHVPLLQSFGFKEDKVICPFREDYIDKFIEDVELPFPPYDYQLKAFKDSIMNVKQINRMCTGCLDGDSEIEVFCDDFSDEELRNML